MPCGPEPMPPRLSIVIPNLNSPVVDRTLAAIRSQRFDLLMAEVLVVGLDGPGLVHQDRLVQLISTGRPAPPAIARNIGLREARGEIVVFTDADCVAEPDWLARLTAPYADFRVSVVGGAVVFETGNYWTLADNLSSFHEFLGGTPPGPRVHLPSLNLSARREVLSAVGGFDERYPLPAGEDSDLSYRLRAAGHTLLFEPAARVRHCPRRSTFGALLRHASGFGRYSVKLRPHPGESPGFRVLRHHRLILLLAPLMATTVTTRIFLRQPEMLRYGHTFPAIFAAKLAWCWGAAHSPEWVRAGRKPPVLP